MATKGVSCEVCSDKASGFHYGVLACNGCKTFFRRAVVKSRKFVCQGEENCEIEKNDRRACRFCRFRRCLEVGMRKDLVQPDRDLIRSCNGGQKVRRRNSSKEESNPQPPSASPESVAEASFGAPAFIKREDSSPTSSSSCFAISKGPSAFIAFHRNGEKKSKIDELLKLESVIERLRCRVVAKGFTQDMSSDLNADYSEYQNMTRLPTGPKDVENSYKLEVVLMRKWLDEYEDFKLIDSASDRDLMQKNFYQKCTCVAGIVRTIRCNLSNSFVLSNNVEIDITGGCNVPLPDEVAEFGNLHYFEVLKIRMKNELVVPVATLKVTEMEYAVIKALLFWEVDVTGISDDAKQKARAVCDILLEELYLALRKERSEVEAAVRLGQVVHVKSALIIFESLNLAQFFEVLNCEQMVNELLFA